MLDHIVVDGKKYYTRDDTTSKLSPKAEFMKARRAETTFGVQLRKLAKHVADIVRGFDPFDPAGQLFMQTALIDYSKAIDPWARSVASRMVAEVDARDRQAWEKVSKFMGLSIQRELQSAPTGYAAMKILNEATALITSLPVDAAQRVRELTAKGLSEGTRADPIAEEIMRTGEVTRARANTIARTETSRTASVLQQVRAMHIGSTAYVWTTVHDADVRPDHRLLDGQTFQWSKPPIADRRTGARANPGQIYNCRCIAVPIIPDF